MNPAPYTWRRLTPAQRQDLLAWRKDHRLPWHRPPHRASSKTRYHVTAACYEHKAHIGAFPERMEAVCAALLEIFLNRNALVHAWCVLPNHYHALVETSVILAVVADLGRMHGRFSHAWNGQEHSRGRKVWCGVVERFMRNDARPSNEG